MGPGDLSTELQCYKSQEFLLPEAQLKCTCEVRLLMLQGNYHAVDLLHCVLQLAIASGRFSLDVVHVPLTLYRWYILVFFVFNKVA